MSRYGISRNKTWENLAVLDHILEEYGAKATIPITTSILSNNPDILDLLDSERLEVAIHGHVHIDYTKLSYDEIISHMKSAMAVCNDNGIKPHGFRAPYLRINSEIIRAVKDVGLEYDSSHTTYFDVVPKDSRNYAQLHRLLKVCKPTCDSPRLSRIEGISEIPITLPDDEMLLDRLNFAPKAIAECWIAAVKESMNLDESVLVLQLHPERVRILSNALIEVLEWVNRNNVRIRNLSEIAEHGTRPGSHCVAITGDIDIVKLSDIARG